ncbi:DsbA family protein [Pseudoduganella sp. UC29_106]|uniref:DsbA family protein n=1 Tax=Pseudoduganella sp. UC29_106 TaxID=3374553 RepID=UPI0037571384
MKVLRLAFYFDLVCPWCWIALRQLESAKARLKETHPGIDVQVDFRSYPLLPELPAAGVDYHEFYSLRFRDPAALAHRRAQVQRAGRASYRRSASTGSG